MFVYGKMELSSLERRKWVQTHPFLRAFYSSHSPSLSPARWLLWTPRDNYNKYFQRFLPEHPNRKNEERWVKTESNRIKCILIKIQMIILSLVCFPLTFYFAAELWGVSSTIPPTMCSPASTSHPQTVKLSKLLSSSYFLTFYLQLARQGFI